MLPLPVFFGYLADCKEMVAFLCRIISSGHLTIAFWHQYAGFMQHKQKKMQT